MGRSRASSAPRRCTTFSTQPASTRATVPSSKLRASAPRRWLLQWSRPFPLPSFDRGIVTLPCSNFHHDMHCPEAVSGVQKIVRPAEQTDVPELGAAEPGEGLNVVQLEKRARGAAPTIRRNKGAPAAIPTVSLSPNRRRYVAPRFVGLPCA